MEIIAPRKENLKKIIGALERGKVVICPTDTVYGLIADAANKKAVEKIFKIKKRKKTKPLAIFVKDIKTAKKFAFIDKKQEKFLKRVWPGKVTVILKRKTALIGREQFSADRQRTVLCNKLLLGGNRTIGLRIPNYGLLELILEKFKKPLAQTSANISGASATTKIKEVIKQFNNQSTRPGLVVDAGNLLKNKPSKVIDLTKVKPKILRY